MSQFSGSPQAGIDYNSTIIGALELSEKKWVLAVQLPGVDRHSRHVPDACGERFVSFVERLKARCASAGRKIARVILTHEAGRDGFWLARFLARRGIEVHVMQPSSLPVDRRARRAKTDMIDAEMLLRTLMAWLRGEPRVCSMVSIPSEADEEARRAYREREDLTRERRSIVNKIDGILAASTGALGGGELTLVNPGEQVVLRFKATRAGVFIYHCAPGGPMIPWHVVSSWCFPASGSRMKKAVPCTTIASTTSARVTSIFRAIEMEFSNLTAHCWNHIQTPSKSCGG